MKNSIWSNVGWTKREIGPISSKKPQKIIEESTKVEFPVDEKFEDALIIEESTTEEKPITEPAKKSKQQVHRELLENYNKKKQQKFIVESRYM